MSKQHRRFQAERQRRKNLRGVLYLVIAVALLGLGAAAVLAPRAPAPQDVRAVVGQPAPDFQFTALNGSTANLSDYQGHPVVLWWIATFCGSCYQGTELFGQNYLSEYKAHGVQMLEVRSNPDVLPGGSDVQHFASSASYVNNTDWVLGTATKAGTLAYNRIGYLDVYYVIDARGIVQATSPGLPGHFDLALQRAEGA